MKIKDLIKKLEEKSQQQNEVQFVVWTAEGDIVCADMSGPMTQAMMRVFAKHAPKQTKEDYERAWLERDNPN